MGINRPFRIPPSTKKLSQWALSSWFLLSCIVYKASSWSLYPGDGSCHCDATQRKLGSTSEVRQPLAQGLQKGSEDRSHCCSFPGVAANSIGKNWAKCFRSQHTSLISLLIISFSQFWPLKREKWWKCEKIRWDQCTLAFDWMGKGRSNSVHQILLV